LVIVIGLPYSKKFCQLAFSKQEEAKNEPLTVTKWPNKVKLQGFLAE
jgi:hypothetical protein